MLGLLFRKKNPQMGAPKETGAAGAGVSWLGGHSTELRSG